MYPVRSDFAKFKNEYLESFIANTGSIKYSTVLTKQEQDSLEGRMRNAASFTCFNNLKLHKYDKKKTVQTVEKFATRGSVT